MSQKKVAHHTLRNIFAQGWPIAKISTATESKIISEHKCIINVLIFNMLKCCGPPGELTCIKLATVRAQKLHIHRVPKKEATKLLPITFSNLNRFSKFFHCYRRIVLQHMLEVSTFRLHACTKTLVPLVNALSVMLWSTLCHICCTCLLYTSPSPRD